MAVALTALIVALGGTGYAATAVRPTGDVQSAVKHSKKPKTDSSQDRTLFNSLAAKLDDKAADLAAWTAYLAATAVPNAKHASSADTATNANHATSADTAGGAPPTGPAGGALNGNYPNPGLAGLENVHRVGAAGEPAFQNSFANTGQEPAGFYKDPFGIVHLVGDVSGGTAITIFTLPTGDRPQNFERFVVRAGADTSGATLRVDPNGNVNIFGGATEATLNGITFRTDQ
jgi:hypothetical protein